MTTKDELRSTTSALANAIEHLANDQARLKYNAAAIRDLAEAHAWLRSPGQPHGGSTSVEVQSS